MKASIFPFNGIAFPTDLKVLTDICMRIYHEYGVQEGSAEADEIRQTAFSLFCAGHDNEDRLVTALRASMERRRGLGASLSVPRVGQSTLRFRP
jgi:hypothetical protein